MNQEIVKKLEAWLDTHFDELVEDIRRVVSLPSVATHEGGDPPFGADCKRVLDEALALAKGYGFEIQNYDNRFGAVTLRPGKSAGDEIGFWGHLDVVPPGDGWQLTQPYAPIVRDGYLIGRGVSDNKGPTIGVMYLLRAFEELHIPTRHGLRLFLGCDEEHGMEDVQYYAAHYPPQKLTITPDCGFPACYAEKGIVEANIVSAQPMETVTALKAGMASNIVPDKATLTLRGTDGADVNGEWIQTQICGGETRIHARGVSSHSANPQGGVNAIHKAMEAALASGLLSARDTQVIDFLKRVNDDCFGTTLHIDASDEVSGQTTCAGTMASMREDGRAVMHLNIRHCISAKGEDIFESMERVCAENGCVLERVRYSAPNYFPRENPVVDALTNAFNEMTGEQRETYVMGGGTYARKLPNALGCGLGGLKEPETTLFEEGHGGAHQPDEHLYLANFKRALVIFAMCVLAADGALE